MGRDVTLRERVETTLYTAGVANSGEIADAVIEAIEDHIREEPEDILIKSNRILAGGTWDGD
jgi:hypothetical protein